jgi:hypothetical protein
MPHHVDDAFACAHLETREGLIEGLTKLVAKRFARTEKVTGREFLAFLRA